MISTKAELFDLKTRVLAEFEVDGATGEISWASQPLEEMFGYLIPGELEGKKVEILVPDSLREVHKSHRSDYVTHPESRLMGRDKELHGQRKDGSVFPVEVVLIPGFAGPQSSRRLVVLGIVFDMTSRQRQGKHS